MGIFRKPKRQQTAPAPVVVERTPTTPRTVTAGDLAPKYTQPDGPLVGPHVYRVPMERDNSQTISHKDLALDWSEFEKWIDREPGQSRSQVRRKVWCLPLEDGTVAFHIPRKGQIGYSRLEQGQALHDAIRVIETHVDGPLRVESFGWFDVKWTELDADGHPMWKAKLLMTRPHLGMYGTWVPVKGV